MNRPTLLAVLLGLLVALPAEAQNPREQKVRDDKKKVEAAGFWIYNDLAKAYADAEKSGKPILVVFRCIPCHECVKLDDELVDQDPRIKPLLEKFVCVRVVSTNGLDLSLFQFDTDQSWAVFFLNADKTIYGRFGTRSHRTEWSDDVSVEGLGKAMQGALELHAKFAQVKASLAGKRGPAPLFASPEKYPSLKDKFTDKLNYDGNVVQSCIHCHQIGDAHRDLLRSQKKPITEELLFPFPHPKALGIVLDPRERATVKAIDKDTLAEKAGFKAGDAIASLNGQPLLSLADIQWVLQQVPAEGGTVKAEVRRGDKVEALTLTLPKGWRRLDDNSWRVSLWGFRRMALGGLVLETMEPAERKTAGLDDKAMGLRVKHVGQFGPHAAAKNAGFQVRDILVSYDERGDFAREGDLLLHSLGTRNAGDKVEVVVLREGKRMTLTLPMQP